MMRIGDVQIDPMIGEFWEKYRRYHQLSLDQWEHVRSVKTQDGVFYGIVGIVLTFLTGPVLPTFCIILSVLYINKWRKECNARISEREELKKWLEENYGEKIRNKEFGPSVFF